MRFARHTMAIVAVAMLGFACGDEIASPGGEMAPPGGSAALWDASTGGDQPVYFLPPLAADPAAPGDLNGDLPVRIEICERTVGSAESGCPESALLQAFGPDAMSVEDDHYHVNWDVQRSGAEAGVAYTIFILLGDLPLASVDVAFAANGRAARQLGAEDVVGLVSRRTLPIKFFVGDLFAPAQEGLDYYGGALSSEGGTRVTRYGGALFSAPPDWIDPAFGDVALFIIEREHSEEAPCLPVEAAGDLVQFGLCYDVFSVPDVGTFDRPATLAQCRTRAARDYGRPLQLAAYHDDEPSRPIEFLPNTAEPPGLDCSSFAFLTRDGSLGSYASALTRKAGEWLIPPLYAGHHGLGGLKTNFSYHAWADPLYLEIAAGDGQTTAAGAAPAEPLEALAVSRHTHDEDADGIPDPDAADVVPYPGLDVTFIVLDEGGTQVGSAQVVPAGPDGVAAFSPVIADAGTYTVVASAPGALTDASFTLVVDEAEAGRTVTGRVFYNTSPLSDYTVEIFEVDGGRISLATTTTDDAGAYAFSGVPDAGRLYITAYGDDPAYGPSGPESLFPGDPVTQDLHVPQKIGPVSPAASSETMDATPTLTWEANPDAFMYRLWVDGGTAVTVFAPTTSYTVETPRAEGSHYWQVSAFNGDEDLVARFAGPAWFTVIPLSGEMAITSYSLPDELILGGGTPYAVTVANGLGADLDGVVVQTWITIGDRVVATGGWMVSCGDGRGVVLSGVECVHEKSVHVPTTFQDVAVPPGPATLHVALRWSLPDPESGTGEYEVTWPVTVVEPN